MDNNSNNDILQICRTCMKEITDTSFFYLDCTQAANSELTIRQKLYICIPELDLSIVPNAVICSKCVDNLLSVYEFKRNCLQLEVQINKYIQQVQHTGDLNLVEVVRFQQPNINHLDITEVCGTNTSNEVFDDYNFNCDLSAAEQNSDTYNSNTAQNCLPEVIEHEDNNYSTNLNKTNACYQCHECGHKAESKLTLFLHLKCHTQNNHKEIISERCNKNLFCYYGCSFCNYVTRYKCLFDFHNRIHLTKKEYKHFFKHIDVITKAFHTTIKVKETNIKVKKRKCAKKCYNYDKHSSKNRNKCKEVSKVNLNRHVRLHTRITREKPFSCSVCKYQCSKKSRLKQHIRIHTGEKPFSCSICEYQCSQKSNLNQHMRVHTEEKPFSCSVCEYKCNHKSQLKQHKGSHTGEKPFSCSVCEYRCSWKSNIKQHMQIHTRAKPFSCSVCKYRCSQKCYLKQHMRLHTGEKPFSCSVCNYQCTHKTNLKRHIQMHTGEKPFLCSVCEYQCSRKSNLNQHMRIHTREKPFSCSTCKYTCSQITQLNRHILIHTKEKPYLCSICKYQSSRKDSLNRHMVIHKREKPLPSSA